MYLESGERLRSEIQHLVLLITGFLMKAVSLQMPGDQFSSLRQKQN